MTDFFEDNFFLNRELSAKDKLIDELIKELEDKVKGKTEESIESDLEDSIYIGMEERESVIAVEKGFEHGERYGRADQIFYVIKKLKQIKEWEDEELQCY